jgi:hypothetical protein
MDLQAMREVVTLNLSPGLNVSGSVDDDGDLVVTAMDGSRRVAAFTDHRTGRFTLRLDDRWVFMDFDYDGEFEVELLQDFCAIVLAYLRGEGEHGRMRVGIWPFGRQRSTLSIEVAGTIHSGIDSASSS